VFTDFGAKFRVFDKWWTAFVLHDC
jgi:hypothetical protein